MKHYVLAAAVAAGLAAPAAAVTVSTLGDQNNSVTPWGLPDTTWYGQTVTFGTDVSLNNFTFRLDDKGRAIGYTAHVYAWDGLAATGASLFSASGSTIGVAGYNDYTTGTNALSLLAGAYVLFWEATSTGSSFWASVEGDGTYAGGGFVFLNHFGQYLVDDPWTQNWIGDGGDLAFAMDYDTAVAPIPLPASLPLLGAGLAGLALLRRRRS